MHPFTLSDLFLCLSGSIDEEDRPSDLLPCIWFLTKEMLWFSRINSLFYFGNGQNTKLINIELRHFLTAPAQAHSTSAQDTCDEWNLLPLLFFPLMSFYFIFSPFFPVGCQSNGARIYSIEENPSPFKS